MSCPKSIAHSFCTVLVPLVCANTVDMSLSYKRIQHVELDRPLHRELEVVHSSGGEAIIALYKIMIAAFWLLTLQYEKTPGSAIFNFIEAPYLKS